jgi:hypothetical protein
VTLSVKAPLSIVISALRPRLVLTITTSADATLRLTLVTAKHRSVAAWTVLARKGRHTLRLTLPAKARHRGVDTLRIVTVGGPTKILHIKLR